MRRLSLKGFKQSGARIDDAKQQLQFMIYHRLCITVPFGGNRIFKEGDEKIFKLDRNKGKYSPNSISISD